MGQLGEDACLIMFHVTSLVVGASFCFQWHDHLATRLAWKEAHRHFLVWDDSSLCCSCLFIGW